MKSTILFVLVLSTLVFCACAQNTNTEDENKTVIRNWYEEGWNKHNPDIADNYIAADYVNHSMKVNNLDEFKKFVYTVLTAFPDIHITLDEQIAEGDKVVTRWTFNATHQGEFMGVQATDKQVTVTGINVVRLVDGKAVEDWGNWDALGLMEQLRAETTMK